MKKNKIVINPLEIDNLIDRVMKLSINEIDLLWKKTGWVDLEAEKDGKIALPTWRLKKIKEDKDFARESFINLVTDTPNQELMTATLFLNNLSKLENKDLKINQPQK